MNLPAAIVIGLKGHKLTLPEKMMLKTHNPVGIILFKRNIIKKQQVIYLIEEIKDILGRELIILVDQEGGTVSRLSFPEWPNFNSSEFFGRLAKINIRKAIRAVLLNYTLIGIELKELGINFNCAPVLDLRVKNASKVIGSRSFSSDPQHVHKLGKAACLGLGNSGVIPIIKHIPGHGRAKVDSHFKIPHIPYDKEKFDRDILPFKKLRSMPAAMTAHIKYLGIDDRQIATHSKIIINEIIRKRIAFKGLIFSDDICMRALKGTFGSRAAEAINSGCDLILHCSGNINETKEAIHGANKITKKAQLKLKKAFEWVEKNKKYYLSKIEINNDLNKVIST